MEKKTYPEILTLENFWNDLKSKHPLAMEHFCNWVDAYKKRVQWDVLFVRHKHPENYGLPAIPKFHEIPVGMQVGIFIEYLTEVDPDTINTAICIDNIKDWFIEREEQLVDDVLISKGVDDKGNVPAEDGSKPGE